MIVVVHVPKTGGTSFRSYLEEIFGPRLHKGYREMQQEVCHPWWQRGLIRLLGLRAEVPRGTACIMGHSPASKYEKAFPRARFAVWLRNPVERVVSHYYHFLRDPNPSILWYRPLLGHAVTLQEFAESPGLRNFHTFKLAQRPLARFDFVGITEHFATGMQLFARVFSLRPPQVIPQVNQNPLKKGPVYELDPGLRDYIRDLNRQDEELYLEGQERFWQLARSHGLTQDAHAVRASA